MKNILKQANKYTKGVKLKTNHNGITLITLVITVIILLILAGVTLSLTLGENGIITLAQRATQNYIEAEEREQAMLSEFENVVNDRLEGIENSDEESGTIDKPVEDNTLANKAQLGDYVKYDTGIEGIGENQDGILTFRVLYNDVTYGLQIISAKNVENVTLGGSTWSAGRTSYNSAIATLNERAEYYVESSPYAIDGRCVGSVPTIGLDRKFSGKNIENAHSAELTFTTTVSGAGNMKGTDTNYIIDQNAMQAIDGMWTTGENYWLASCRTLITTTYSDYSVINVKSDGSLSTRTTLCGIYSDAVTTYGHVVTRGLRPCISLNTDVKIVDGDGSEETPFELSL